MKSACTPAEAGPLEESELVERARGGDAAAYETLVRRYEALAFRVAFVILSDAGEAEDAAQEAFLKAWQALPRFRGGAPVRPWLLRIVANEARNRRTAAGRRGRLALRTTADRVSTIRRRLPRRPPWRWSGVPTSCAPSTPCVWRIGW